MKGTFRKGDLLVLEPCLKEKLHKGDIIAFRNTREIKDNEMIVHRIIRIDKGYLFTRGDNNKRPDIIPVSNSALVGKVISYERNGKNYRAIGGLTGLISARIFYFFRRTIYWFLIKIRWLLPINLIGNMLNKLWKYRIKKIKLSTKDGPIIKWVFRNRTIAHWLPENRLQKTSFLSRFLINSKKPN
jgi:signal peptidase I